MSTLVSLLISLHRRTFACSPPLKTRTWLSMCLVVSPHFARADRTSYCVNDGNSFHISSMQVDVFLPSPSCSKYPTEIFCPSSHVPFNGFTSPRMLRMSVVFPIPLAPVKAIFCPRSRDRFRGLDRGSS